MSDFVVVFLCAVVLYLCLLWGTRIVMRKLLHRRMYARVETVAVQGAGPAGEVATSPVRELPAARALSIEVINSAWSSDDGDTHARLTREARRPLRQSCVLDVIVVVTFVFLMTRPDTGDADWIYVMALVLPVTPLRYLFHRRQYWVGGADPWKTRIFGRFLGSPPQLTLPLWALHKLSSPALQYPLRWGLLAALCWVGIERVQAGLSWGWAAVFVALAIAAVDVALWLKLRQQRGVALLLLRVFHKDDNGMRSAVATFGGVLSSWLNFGAFFTVMDDTLLRFRSPMFSALNVAVLVGLYYYLAAFADGGHVMAPADYAIGGAAILLAWAIDAWLVYRNGFARLVTDTSQIPRIVRQTHAARGPDFRFRSVEVPCLNSTWYQAVTAIAGQAEIVLMDLRGYSPARAGCDVEVNLLFDAVALRRIVFMIEPGKLDEIEALFERCWRDLAADSPNLKLPDPTVSVIEYPLDNETPKDLIAEKQILLEELLFRTTGQAVGHKEQAKSATRRVIDAARLKPAADAMQPVSAVQLVSEEVQPAAQATDRPLATSQTLTRAKVAARAGLSAPARAAVRAAITGFAGARGLYVGDAIPARKLRNARMSAFIPPEEKLLALVDMTVFGSAKDCLVFTDVALRYRYLGERFVLEYKFFPWRRFSAQGLRKIEVMAPDGTAVTIESFQAELPRHTMLELLEALSAAVAAHPAVPPEADALVGAPGGPAAGLSARAVGAVRAALAAAKGHASVLVGDEISEKKATNARAACFIPPEEELLALVDTTAFGSAKHCWAFTDLALRYCDSSGRHVVEYKHFPVRRFVSGRGDSVEMHAPDGGVIKFADTGGSAAERIALLEAIRAAVSAQYTPLAAALAASRAVAI